MRPLTVKEIELIMGTNAFTTPLTGTSVTATIAPTGGGSSGGDPGGGDGNGGSGGGDGGGGGGGGTPDDHQHCYTPLAAEDRVDTSLIEANEGGLHTTGYTLDATQFPNSGVTIGAGVDLGSQSAAGLQGLGVAQTTIDTLNPFFGLKGQSAVDAVTAHGAPVLSEADATALSKALQDSTRSTVASSFNAATTGVQFDQLPASAQTVIVDVAYPSGPNLASAAPNFWGDVTTGNWSAAVTELQNFWSAGNTDARHTADANLLQADITSSTLPSDTANGQCP